MSNKITSTIRRIYKKEENKNNDKRLNQIVLYGDVE